MFIIRADGNAKIGAGHLMRCLTIAEALQKVLREEKGIQNGILFVCADADSAQFVEEHGFAARALDTDYQVMEQELPEWKKLWEEQERKTSLKHKIPDVILIDSYFVTDSYLVQLKKCMRGFTLILMDDMQEHAYPADGIINYNVFADEGIYRTLYPEGQGSTALYLGSRYVPVRKQFLDKPYQVADKVRTILITTGGGDIDNIAGRILKALLEVEKGKNNGEHCEKLNYNIIMGRFNPGFEEMMQLAAASPNIHVHYDVQDMAALMRAADLAITAGGSTIYELAAVGIPFICFSYAKNQELLTEYIGGQKITGFAGAYHKNPDAVIWEIQKLFAELRGSTEKRNECYLKERQLIDGQGAMRLVREALLG